MSRQTSVALSEEDEIEFLAFLRADADVRVLRSTAPTLEQIFVPQFLPRQSGEDRFHLWNAGFTWNPEFAQYGPDRRDGAASHFYPKNTSGAPLVEYLREQFDDPEAIVRGRIYWNTWHDIYRGPSYDVEAFERWFDRMVRWLRKRGRRVEMAKGWYQYWLPGAWEKRVEVSSRRSGDA